MNLWSSCLPSHVIKLQMGVPCLCSAGEQTPGSVQARKQSARQATDLASGTFFHSARRQSGYSQRVRGSREVDDNHPALLVNSLGQT